MIENSSYINSNGSLSQKKPNEVVKIMARKRGCLIEKTIKRYKLKLNYGRIYLN
ncbi:hypothetical protein NEF87_001939 [Candidatus Lokiarchaeum ossiferum]|uniref:Uncharacterized protein n=1 Tax=Candidatus Lokiarchaeum ossiferum TaxID=2951803 RepID=A0ABY6HQ71_9ARCH|nr:hypothetical protein NEF87_001939 [Candidatus Lokiarchaeum sp. B-35]